MFLYKEALTNGLEKLRKYYLNLDKKLSFVLALGKISGSFILFILMDTFAVLHPYYKLAYIKLSWGAEKEQDAAIAAGNLNAKNWHDEAKQLIERTVRCVVIVKQDTVLTAYKIDGQVL